MEGRAGGHSKGKKIVLVNLVKKAYKAVLSLVIELSCVTNP